jgi:hypothetical protein
MKVPSLYIGHYKKLKEFKLIPSTTRIDKQLLSEDNL